MKRIKLKPPYIHPRCFEKKIVCTRPMREEKFNISVEHKGSKTLVHCYGHGGSGWTTLFGSIKRALEQFSAINRSKSQPVAILGAGCMGLLMAIELTRLGFSVSRIIASKIYDTPSWNAGSYFGLVSLKTSQEEIEVLKQIGLDTFDVYETIERGLHPYLPKQCVRLMPVYCSEETDSGVAELEKLRVIPSKESVILDFENGFEYHNFVKYITYFMDTTLLMEHLFAVVHKSGIPITLKMLNAFEEVEENILFNCTGMGSQQLNGDKVLIPVRGHLIALNQHAGSLHMDYMIYTLVDQDGKKEYVYSFPKNRIVTADQKRGIAIQGILGGSFLANIDQLPLEKQLEMDTIAFQRLSERNAAFFGGTPC